MLRMEPTMPTARLSNRAQTAPVVRHGARAGVVRAGPGRRFRPLDCCGAPPGRDVAASTRQPRHNSAVLPLGTSRSALDARCTAGSARHRGARRPAAAAEAVTGLEPQRHGVFDRQPGVLSRRHFAPPATGPERAPAGRHPGPRDRPHRRWRHDPSGALRDHRAADAGAGDGRASVRTGAGAGGQSSHAAQHCVRSGCGADPGIAAATGSFPTASSTPTAPPPH